MEILKTSYREAGPEFASGLDACIFLIEGLATKEVPWTQIIPERFVVALHAAGLIPTLRALGTKDALNILNQINLLDSEPGTIATKVLNDLETNWAMQTELKSRSGMRELVLHLVASGKDVLFVSTLPEHVARNVLASSLKLGFELPVFGRQRTADRSSVLNSAFDAAAQSLDPSMKYARILHASVVSEIKIEVDAETILVGHDNTTLDSKDIIDLAAQCALTTGERTYIDKQLLIRNRINGLRQKEGLTNAEMAEYLDLKGGGRQVGNSERYGYVDVQTGTENARLIRYLRRAAAEHHHFLEIISIDATLIEIELRNWLIVHRDRSFEPDVRMTFGQTVDMAAQSGFPQALVKRLRTFNGRRNEAVHRLARGTSSYVQMAGEYLTDCSLLFDVEDFVLQSAPIIGKKTEHF